MKQIGDTSIVPEKIRQIYAIIHELEERFEGSKFSMDGHLLGSIGEVLAAEHYGLSLLENSAKTHDAKTKDGKLVQIKTTQKNRIAISSEPKFLLVLHISENGDWQEIYNGPGALPWASAGNPQKNGQRILTFSKLQALMAQVPPDSQIPPISRDPETHCL